MKFDRVRRDAALAVGKVEEAQAGHGNRDRDLLELAKKEATAVLSGPNYEISQSEVDRALWQMRTRWQKTYGLVEVG